VLLHRCRLVWQSSIAFLGGCVGWVRASSLAQAWSARFVGGLCRHRGHDPSGFAHRHRPASAGLRQPCSLAGSVLRCGLTRRSTGRAGRCAAQTNHPGHTPVSFGVRQLMTRSSHILIVLVLSSQVSGGESLTQSEFIGVTCNSADGGKTCYGYNETYGDGTSDSCGRVPDGGPEFALKLTYTVSGNISCETVVKTSHPEVMPVGEKFCVVNLTRESDSYTYRFTDDEPTRIRRGYYATRADKWCQGLIDLL
jgi:hypothetical protein